MQAVILFGLIKMLYSPRIKTLMSFLPPSRDNTPCPIVTTPAYSTCQQHLSTTPCLQHLPATPVHNTGPQHLSATPVENTCREHLSRTPLYNTCPQYLSATPLCKNNHLSTTPIYYTCPQNLCTLTLVHKNCQQHTFLPHLSTKPVNNTTPFCNTCPAQHLDL